MSNVQIDYAVHFIFVLQIIVVSVYVSFRWRSSRAKFLKTYQKDKFPNLYTQNEDTEFARLRIRKYMDYSIAALGLLILLVIRQLNVSTEDIVSIMLYFTVCQLIPLLVSAYWCQNSLNEMQKRYPQNMREADLGVPMLTSYIRPMKVVLLIGVYLSFFSLSLYIVITGAWGAHMYKLILLTALTTAVFFWTAYVVYKALYGKRDNHFIDTEERESKRYDLLNRVINVSTIFCAFIIAIQMINIYELNSVIIGLCTSILLQAIVFSTRNQYFPLNPSAYK